MSNEEESENRLGLTDKNTVIYVEKCFELQSFFFVPNIFIIGIII